MSESPLSRISTAAIEDAAVSSGAPPPEDASSFSEKLEKAIHTLGKAFAAAGKPGWSRFSPGHVAQLRRLDHRKGHASTSPAFWQVVVHELEKNGLLREGAGDDTLRPWMAILQGLATVRELDGPGVSLGKAISKAGISEARLTRLLQARGDALLNQVRPLAHQLRSQAQTVNWAEVAKLVLSDGEPWADNVRRQAASSFYRHQSRKNKKESS